MQIIKKIRDKNHLLILLIFFLQIILPLIIFGHIGLIPGDRLEGVAHDYIISKLYNGKIEYIDYFLGGSYEWFFFETVWSGRPSSGPDLSGIWI